MIATPYRARLFIGLCSLALSACATTPRPQPATPAPSTSQTEPDGARFVREELYFGSNRRTGGEVSDSAWNDFLRRVITPLFPDGLTVLRGHGQYRLADGRIEQEGTHVVILLYQNAPSLVQVKDVAIQQIIRRYREQFDQESVLRVTTLVRTAL